MKQFWGRKRSMGEEHRERGEPKEKGALFSQEALLDCYRGGWLGLFIPEKAFYSPLPALDSAASLHLGHGVFS